MTIQEWIVTSIATGALPFLFIVILIVAELTNRGENDG